ncbi:hypothetical protein [Mycobacteroides abscessus]|uniref:hypothetical protein n=1 Tax=Mycobacteroides abscessus TaxID=36809 RepID=UPI00092BCF18|nr:hypothetical protein [Mycobacteroides abscessus]SHQ48137.1 Uncharacterised protein [Mycobacteroides abscessus subsp. abscessus]SKQ85618.1 Uncharacterised protein [Mycobacteroides abscessus subsp. massiliense]SLC48863.1 Uncharacterised protein [Mycobacteroides abscessus subsp. massiliense]
MAGRKFQMRTCNNPDADDRRSWTVEVLTGFEIDSVMDKSGPCRNRHDKMRGIASQTDAQKLAALVLMSHGLSVAEAEQFAYIARREWAYTSHGRPDDATTFIADPMNSQAAFREAVAASAPSKVTRPRSVSAR